MALNNFGRNLKALREKVSITQTQLAEALGVTQNTVSGWETREKLPRSKEVVEKIEELYGVTYQDLYGFSDGLYAKLTGLTNLVEGKEPPGGSTRMVIGNIAAGDPREAFEFTGEEHYVNPDVLQRYPEGFLLKIAGDSMDKVIPEGSYVYIADAEHYSWGNGDIVAVKVNGDDATVKRITATEDIFILTPESTNPEWQRIIIDSTNPDAPYFKVLGKVVWFDKEL